MSLLELSLVLLELFVLELELLLWLKELADVLSWGQQHGYPAILRTFGCSQPWQRGHCGKPISGPPGRQMLRSGSHNPFGFRPMFKRLTNNFHLWYYRRFKPKPRGPLFVDGAEVRPSGVRGLHMVVSSKGAGSRLISSQQTTDPDNYWRWWRQLGGQAMLDEDGDLFLPWR